MKIARLILLTLALVPLARAGDVFTAKTYDRAQMRAAILASGAKSTPPFAAPHYAEISRAELTVQHALFLRRLSKDGVGVSPSSSGWDRRFNCVAFVQRFVVELQLALFKEQFHAYSQAERPAIVPVAFTTRVGTCHCVALILTDKGAVWWDPQLGEINLTAEEAASIWFPQT